MNFLGNVLLVLFALFLLIPIAAFIGYAITLACAITLSAMVVLVVLSRKDIKQVLSRRMNRYSLIALSAIVLFFLIFSVFFLKRTELIFFDEQIYQSIAMNMMNHGNALTCWYGTAQLKECYLSTIGFDPSGWPFLIALASKLFGAGSSTSYALELFIGAASIIIVFLLASVLTRKKEIPIMAAAIFALVPELFVWSKTLANPNMPFMMFATLTLFFFVLFVRKSTKPTLMLAAFSMAFTVYLRVEALLLIPILVIIAFTLSEKGVKETFKIRMASLLNKDALGMAVRLSIVFLLLIAPEIIVTVITRQELLQNALSFMDSSTKLFSLSYLPENLLQNVSFFAGRVTEYPIIFLPEIMLFAVIGVASLLSYDKKPHKDGVGVLLLLLLTFLGYFMFYSSYFSGSALSGGGVRFMLITYPQLSILAAFGVCGVSDWIAALANGKGRQSKKQTIWKYGANSVLVIAFFILPFLCAVPFLMHPNYNYADFPIIPSTIPQNDPYSMMYTNRSLSFIDNNYALVPADCLVFSPSPYLWYGLDRSSATVSIYNESIPDLKNYSCFALDYGYFCGYPFNDSACNAMATKYRLKVLATESGDMKSNFSLYQILNYTPS
jgi:hypothetical protein